MHWWDGSIDLDSLLFVFFTSIICFLKQIALMRWIVWFGWIDWFVSLKLDFSLKSVICFLKIYYMFPKSNCIDGRVTHGKLWSVKIFFVVWEGDAKLNRWGRGGTKKTSEMKRVGGGRKYQRSTKKTRWGGTKKNLEARLPTAPLGVEIIVDDVRFKKNLWMM